MNGNTPARAINRLHSGTAEHLSVGNGPPMLFLHGFWLGPGAYVGTLDCLAGAGFGVVAPFLPGHAHSKLGSQPVSVPAISNWLDELMLDLGIETVSVVGYSFGAAIALKFAHDHPERVKTLILLSPVGGTDWKLGRSGIIPLDNRPTIDWATAYFRKPRAALELGVAFKKVAKEGFSQLIRHPMSTWTIARLAMHVDLNKELAELKASGISTTIVSASDDVVIPTVSSDSLVRLLGAKSIQVEGSHHWILARPDQVAAIVTKAISDP